MPRPLNILRVITWLPPGGIERKILAVLPRLNPQRFRCRVLCLRERGALADELQGAGTPVDLIAFRSRLDPRGLRRFARHLRQHEIDLVHAHMYRASVPATIAARLAGGLPVVSQVHNVGTWESRRQVWMDRFLCRWRRGLIAVSERVKRDVIETLGVAPEFVRVIYNGVDLSQFTAPVNPAQAKKAAGFDPDATVVLMAARLVEQKNPLGFVELARRITPRFPKTVFAIAGAGPLEDPIRREAERASLGRRFRLLGLRDPMAPVYQAADLFVLPSHKEGFSNALIEAMACGLPVAAADVGGNAEAVGAQRDGAVPPPGGEAAGLIVPPGHADSLEHAVAALLSDAPLRASLAQAACRRAQRFSLDRMVADLEALYLELAGGEEKSSAARACVTVG